MQTICNACSFAKEKLLAWSEAVQEVGVENTLEKINNGDIKIKSYIINDGERLWDIAESIIAEAGINVDTREVVNVIKNINKAMNIDVNVLQPGQTIYIPVDIKEVL